MKALKYLALALFFLSLPGLLSNTTVDAGVPGISGTRITVDGKKIFPVGFYHGSWATTDAKMLQALNKIADAGYNLMIPALGTDDEAFLAQAKARGVHLIVEPNDVNTSDYVIKAWGNRPEIIGWTIADDVNEPGSPWTLANLATQRAYYDQYASRHLTYITAVAMGGVTKMQPWFGQSEAYGIQVYAISSDPASRVDVMLQQAITARGTKQEPLIANLQAFAFGGDRAPTPDEERSMTYQALINNVDGIVYYTYVDEEWNIENYPALWAELVKLGGETKAFAPIMLDGTYTRLNNPANTVYAARWQYLGKYYYVIINGNATTVNNVTVPVGAGMRSVTPMFAGRPSGFTLQGTNIVGSMAGNSVHVYIVEPSAGVVTATPTPLPTTTPTGPTPTQDWGVQVTGLTLINTATNTVVRTLTNNDMIDVKTLPNFTIRAETFPTRIGTVEWKVNGALQEQDSDQPYSIFADTGLPNTRYYAWNYNGTLGARTIEAIPYAVENSQGNRGRSMTINITIYDSRQGTPPTATKTPVPAATATKTSTPVFTATKTATPVYTPTKTATPVSTATKTPTKTSTPAASPSPTRTPTTVPGSPRISSLTLMNAANAQGVITFTNGVLIDMSSLGLTKISIRANPATVVAVGSVKFGVDGNPNFRIENSPAPFSIAGDTNGVFNAWTFGYGIHTITATPYTGANATGTAGVPYIIVFTVQP